MYIMMIKSLAAWPLIFRFPLDLFDKCEKIWYLTDECDLISFPLIPYAIYNISAKRKYTKLGRFPGRYDPDKIMHSQKLYVVGALIAVFAFNSYRFQILNFRRSTAEIARLA